MFVIPDEFLESTICDSCDKFLSVGPVKTYSNGKIKCGRCTKETDTGAYTAFGLFGEQGWFKCVNRFDGCRKLLGHTQVLDHESTCHSKIKTCPLCPTKLQVPTFMLIKHFKERHADHILSTPSFRTELENPPLNVFLYRHGDHLFFVKYQVQNDLLKLGAHYIGKRGHETLTQKFHVYFGDDAVLHETKTRPCSVGTAENFTTFSVPIPKGTCDYVFVEFQLELGELELALSIEDATATAPVPKIGLPRTIHIREENNNPLVSVGPSGTSLIVRQSEFFMFCICCQASATASSSVVEIGPSKYHIFCSQCRWFAKENLGYWKMFETGVAGGNYEYSCIWREWGCDKLFTNSNLETHEPHCHHQPSRPCPVHSCIFKGTLPQIETHFKLIHPKVNFFLSKEFLLVDRSFDLDDVFFCVWAHYDFIVIKVEPVDVGVYEMSFGKWKKGGFSGKRQPKIMVVGLDGTETSMIKTGDSPVILDNSSRVHISCFYTDKKTDVQLQYGLNLTKKLPIPEDGEDYAMI